MNVQNSTKRIQWIDFAKFLGILFVLLSHMELRIPYVSAFGYLFFVPIFFVLAGYTYQKREESFWNFIKRKGKRLLTPYFGYSLFLFLFFFVKDHVLRGSVSLESLRPLLGILYARNSLYPLDAADNIYFMTILNSPMWFLPALFLSSVLFEICIRISKNSWKRLLVNNVLTMAIGICIMYATPVLLPWSLDTICLFEVFISAGFILKKQMETIDQSEEQKNKARKRNQQLRWNQNYKYIITMVILMALAIIVFLANGPMNVSVGDFGETVSLGVVAGIISSYSIILLCYMMRGIIPEGAVLIGKSSLTIMCLHMFVFAFIITGINILNPRILTEDSVGAVFVKAMAVSVTLAILTIFDICKNRKPRTSL